MAFKPLGLRRGVRNPAQWKQRTLALIPCYIGVIGGQWHRGYFSVYPIRHSWANGSKNPKIMTSRPAGKHIIHLSQNWSNALNQGLAGSTSDLAKLSGLTPGRVRQILWLADLDPTIIRYLEGLRKPSALRKFPEKKLRPLVSLPLVKQIETFETEFRVKIPCKI